MIAAVNRCATQKQPQNHCPPKGSPTTAAPILIWRRLLCATLSTRVLHVRGVRSMRVGGARRALGLAAGAGMLANGLNVTFAFGVGRGGVTRFGGDCIHVMASVGCNRMNRVACGARRSGAA